MINETLLPPWLIKRETHDQDFPAWFAAFRQQQWERFLKQGLPTSRNERFKYVDFSFLKDLNLASAKKEMDTTNIEEKIGRFRLQHGDSILLVFIDGQFYPQYSEIDQLPEKSLALSFKNALQSHPELIHASFLNNLHWDNYPFAQLNAASFKEGFFCYIPDNCQLRKPLHFLFLNQHGDQMEHAFHRIVIGERSEVSILEDYQSLNHKQNLLNVVKHILVSHSAQLNQFKILNDNQNAIHIAHTFIEQAKHSQVTNTNISMNFHFNRDDLLIQLQEEGAKCSARGLYFTNHDHQLVDQHVDIIHAAPQSQSEMIYKGILDKKSRAVFNGKLQVLQKTQKILAQQANHNLLLAQQVELFSKPELEIYADDVKCTHGATVGQLDPEALFYLRSRGLDEESATKILLEGFVDDILQRITPFGIQQHILVMVPHADRYT